MDVTTVGTSGSAARDATVVVVAIVAGAVISVAVDVVEGVDGGGVEGSARVLAGVSISRATDDVDVIVVAATVVVAVGMNAVAPGADAAGVDGDWASAALTPPWVS